MNPYKKNLLLINNFLDYIRNHRRYSEHTFRAYKNDLLHFIDYLGEDKMIIKINKYDLHEYVTSISKSILSKVNSIAVIGASSNPSRDSNKVIKFLIDKGYEVFPINPKEKENCRCVYFS